MEVYGIFFSNFISVAEKIEYQHFSLPLLLLFALNGPFLCLDNDTPN